MRLRRRVTLQPTGMPSRSLKFDTELLGLGDDRLLAGDLAELGGGGSNLAMVLHALRQHPC